MEYFIQQLINGLTLGSIYGLIAIGYTMVYGIIGMINFAHGDIFMLGAFIALIVFLILVSLFATIHVVFFLLVMMIVGGALVPPLQGVLIDHSRSDQGFHLSFVLPVLCYAYLAWYGFKGAQHA